MKANDVDLRFVSIGTADKIQKFLDLNPNVPRESLYVDDETTFAAYDDAGFASLDTSPGKKIEVTLPRLGSAGAWWRYLTNVASLSPVPKQFKFGEIPRGVLRLGGTFVIKGDSVLFAHADQFPGDHPNISDVLRAAGFPPSA